MLIRLVTDYLDSTAKRFPDKSAIVDGDNILTFATLRDNAGRVATGLANLGVFHQPVAVYLKQSAESIVSFLGAAYSGNFYSVLDAEAPPERLRKIMDTLEPAVIITDEEHIKTEQIFGGGGENPSHIGTVAR